MSSATTSSGTANAAIPGKTSSAKFAEAEAKYADKMASMTDGEKSLLGLPYLASDGNLIKHRIKTRNLLREYNSTQSGPAPGEEGQFNDVSNAKRREILGKLFEITPEAVSRIFIEPPFYW
jgi:hypothetical protein